jgi:hypothetical protein
MDPCIVKARISRLRLKDWMSGGSGYLLRGVRKSKQTSIELALV